ncbi:MAG: YidC/Oxa1 family insertase periplasmic-domain containing protein, partial [Planctomycetota bacterium]
MKTALTLVVVVYVLFCGWLVIETGLFDGSLRGGDGCILLQQTTATEPAPAAGAPESDGTQLKAAKDVSYGANHAPDKTVTLGSADRTSGYKYAVELVSIGAAMRTATFSEFDDRDHKDPQQLVIISPIQDAAGEILAMANRDFVFVDHGQRFPLDKLHWKIVENETTVDTARFEATLKNEDTGEPVIKLTKTYRIRQDSYLLDCDITVENLGDVEQEVRFNMSGPGGFDREGFRTDNRKIVAGYRNSKNEIVSTSLSKKALAKAKKISERRPKDPGGEFLWVATTNKYFAAIVVPLTDGGKPWLADKAGRFYDPDGDPRVDSGDETLGLDLGIDSNTLAATGQAGSSRTYKFQMYLGPKDKSLFDKNEQYNSLGFYHTIDFMGCCCPDWIIKPLAFGILWLMKVMYGIIPNYGVVIIILVFCMRLCMHPITKKSQVSMSKMSQLAPKAEEIKKKYA